MQLRLFSQIVEQSPVSVVVTDPDGTIRYANPNFTRVTGYSLAEVVGKNPRLLSSGQTSLDVYQAMWSGVLNRSSWRGELLNKKKSGEMYWEEAIIFPILDDHGQVAHLVGIKEDVSARKASVAMLEERTRLVQHHYECLRALSDIAALPDLAGGRQLAEALALGARHLELPLGIVSRVEGGTYTVLNHVAPEPAALHDGQTFSLGQTYCAMTLESGDVVAIAEMGNSPRAGHPCYRAFGLETYIGAPVTVAGRVVGTVNFSSPEPLGRQFDDGDIEFMRLLARWIGAVLERDQASRDILTARDQAEAARRDLSRQARKLADINAELEQFAYVASHDLRQPLRMISSYITLIQRHLGDSLDEELAEYFGFVVGGARRMDALIVGLLDYSRTGRSGASFEAVKLSEVVSESLLNLAVTIREANAEVTVADGLPVVNGNRTDLVRLFQNLIGNAVKYRAPDRPVRVSVAARAEGAEWTVSVEDNGIGIAADHRDRVFGIFQRLVTSDEYEGTGIGLAVCRKIMDLHGGRIWVEDAADQGCRFLVAFPKG
jgi:PAS domain S-box-containing protein